ncbi:TetR/AcrR family transcriptional regulator [Ancylobacter dichloromethanicus]
MQGQGGRPSRQEAAALDARLLDGARAAFGRKGIANTSLEEIATSLGISKHTLYRRHASKQALLDAVVERDMRTFREALLAASVDGEAAGPLETLRRVAFRYVEIGSRREYAAFYLSVCAEAALSAALRHRLALWSERALEPLSEAIGAALEAGVLRAGNPAEITALLVDLLEGVNNRLRLAPAEDDNGETLMSLFDRRWTAFLAATAKDDERA